MKKEILCIPSSFIINILKNGIDELDPIYNDHISLGDQSILSFSNFKISEPLTLEGSFMYSPTFSQCTFESDVMIQNIWSQGPSYPTFLNGKYKDIIIAGDFEALCVEGTDELNQLVIKNSKMKHLVIANNKMTTCIINKSIVEATFLYHSNKSMNTDFKFEITHSAFASADISVLKDNIDTSISRSLFKGLKLSGIIEESCSLNLNNNFIIYIQFINLNTYGSFIIDNLIASNRSLRTMDPEFTPFLYEKFISSSSSKTLKFENNNFKSLVVKNAQLDFFDEIVIVNTDLSHIILKNSLIKANTINLKSSSPINVYELFNSLYTSAKIKNNKREQEEYYKGSLIALYNQHLQYRSLGEIPTLISLAISNLYSNYGTNWMKSLGVTLMLAAIFFTFMMLTTAYDISFTEQGFLNFQKLAVYYVHFLNPAHKIDFMDTLEFAYSNKLGFVVFDLLGRIFIGIGIFEMIKSFRKYARR